MRTSGGYKTRQRESILLCLKENPNRHLTVDEIVGLLNEKGGVLSVGSGVGAGKTTVYRYLDKLCAEGLVRKYLLPDGEGSCYQLCSAGCSEHFHLKCLSCGKLIHMECDLLSHLGGHIKEEHNFILDTGRTVLYGYCGECQEAKNAKSNNNNNNNNTH